MLWASMLWDVLDTMLLCRLYRLGKEQSLLQMACMHRVNTAQVQMTACIKHTNSLKHPSALIKGERALTNELTQTLPEPGDDIAAGRRRLDHAVRSNTEFQQVVDNNHLRALVCTPQRETEEAAAAAAAVLTAIKSLELFLFYHSRKICTITDI